jgi:hypothetical protein
MMTIAASIAAVCRPWAALLALLGMVFVAGSVGPLPRSVADFGHLCSAQGARQPQRPDAPEQHDCCVLCPVGQFVGSLPEPVAAPSAPVANIFVLVPAAPDRRPGRVAGAAQARAPPSV